ncbi:MAG: hypothetical protein RMK02_01855 [Burkholderiales bacterium]|nr:hypothetical protein [Burkholderiales bacterium]
MPSAARGLFLSAARTERARLPRVRLLLVLLALAACAAPSWRAGLTIDDWVFTATARLVGEPWSAFWQAHYYEPLYFRPVGLVLWWLVQHASGAAASAQFVANFVLHAANALLAASLLRALGQPPRAIVWAAALVAFGPMALAASLWPSNRFDLLATAFVLGSARCWVALLMRPTPGYGIALWGAGLLFALLACFSKESAYPILATLALVIALTRRLGEHAVPRRLAAVHAATLAGVVVLCFLWRHWIVPYAYAAVPSEWWSAGVAGGVAWSLSAARWFDLLWPGHGPALAAAWAGLFAVAFAWAAAQWRWLALALALLAGAAVLPQLPLVGTFAVMLDGEPLGTLSFARFYYTPWVALSLVAAVGLGAQSGARVYVLGGLFAALLVATTSAVRSEAARYVAWSTGALARLVSEATAVTQAVAAQREACVVVFLDTQLADPGGWFARFADAAVGALSGEVKTAARCYVLTETTPFVFVQPSAEAGDGPSGLTPIINPDGSVKADQVWGGVRFRYRLPPASFEALREGRFFVWREGGFEEVTEAVRRGEHRVVPRSWGF